MTTEARILETTADLTKYVMDHPTDDGRYLIRRGLDDVYRLTNRARRYSYRHPTHLELSGPLGKLIWDAWPKRPPYRGAPVDAPATGRTLLGVLKLVNAPGYKTARRFITDTNAAEKLAAQERTARSVRQHLVRKLNEAREVIEHARRFKRAIPLDLESDVAQLDALVDRIVVAFAPLLGLEQGADNG